MNAARIVVLAFALSAGGVAAYLSRGSDENPVAAEAVAQLATTQILIAKSNIGPGPSVDAEEGMNAPAGTVTLELKSEQAETPALSRHAGTLLALHSITDINMVEGGSDDQAPKRGSSINVVRYRIASQSTAQK